MSTTSLPAPADPDTTDRRYRNTSLRLPDDERTMLLALIDAGEVPDLATLVRASIRERHARMQASRGAAWPQAVVPVLLVGPSPDGAPYTCPFTGEVLIGRAGLAILPGPVLGPYVSGRFLSDPTLSSADKGPDAAP